MASAAGVSEQEISQLITQVSFLESQMLHYQSKIAETTQAMHKAQSKCAKGNGNGEPNVFTVAKNRLRASHKKKELNRLNASLTGIQTSLQKMNDKVRSLQQNISTTPSSLRFSGNSTINSNTTSTRQQPQRILTAIPSSVINGSNNGNNSRNNGRSLTSLHETHTQTNSSISERSIDSQSKILDTHHKNIKSMEAKLSQCVKTITTVQTTKDDIRNQKSSYSSSDYKSLFTQLENQLSTLQKEKLVLSTQLQETRKEFTNLQNNILSMIQVREQQQQSNLTASTHSINQLTEPSSQRTTSTLQSVMSTVSTNHRGHMPDLPNNNHPQPNTSNQKGTSVSSSNSNICGISDSSTAAYSAIMYGHTREIARLESILPRHSAQVREARKALSASSGLQFEETRRKYERVLAEETRLKTLLRQQKDSLQQIHNTIRSLNNCRPSSSPGPSAHIRAQAQRPTAKLEPKSNTIDCVICMSDIQRSEAYALPCSHIFHYACLKDWMKVKSICPICKLNVKWQANS